VVSPFRGGFWQGGLAAHHSADGAQPWSSTAAFRQAKTAAPQPLPRGPVLPRPPLRRLIEPCRFRSSPSKRCRPASVACNVPPSAFVRSAHPRSPALEARTLRSAALTKPSRRNGRFADHLPSASPRMSRRSCTSTSAIRKIHPASLNLEHSSPKRDHAGAICVQTSRKHDHASRPCGQTSPNRCRASRARGQPAHFCVHASPSCVHQSRSLVCASLRTRSAPRSLRRSPQEMGPLNQSTRREP
jgi:hypothetical protein